MITLSVSVGTTKRSFSAIYIVKIEIGNKMEDDFLMDFLIMYAKREISIKFSTETSYKIFKI